MKLQWTKKQKLILFLTETNLWPSRCAAGKNTILLYHLNEARIYKPSENLLKLRASFKLVLKCDYALLYYPFDAQHCFIKVLP